jgi:hypothetical protein
MLDLLRSEGINLGRPQSCIFNPLDHSVDRNMSAMVTFVPLRGEGTNPRSIILLPLLAWYCSDL